MASSSAATATMLPEAQRDSLSTSEFTRVSDDTLVSGNVIDIVLLLSLFSSFKQERNLIAAISAHLLRPMSAT